MIFLNKRYFITITIPPDSRMSMYGENKWDRTIQKENVLFAKWLHLAAFHVIINIPSHYHFTSEVFPMFSLFKSWLNPVILAGATPTLSFNDFL
jgi:2'-5' RNA ligase